MWAWSACTLRISRLPPALLACTKLSNKTRRDVSSRWQDWRRAEGVESPSAFAFCIVVSLVVFAEAQSKEKRVRSDVVLFRVMLVAGV